MGDDIEAQANICERCGGLVRIEFTMGFERCSPQDLRVDPPHPIPRNLCPGHPNMLDGGDWDKLTNEQKHDLEIIRSHIGMQMARQKHLFLKKHIDLDAYWDFQFEVHIKKN